MTGPSLTSSTDIRAPKTPVSTGTPSSRKAAQNRSYSGSAAAGAAAPEKLGRLPSGGVGDQRELADHQRGAARLEQRAVELPVVVLEDAELRHLLGEPTGVGVTVAGRDPEEDADPGPDRAAGRNRRAGHPLDDGSHGSSRSRMRAA